MKKIISILLVTIMLFTMVPTSVFAADGTAVKLVSFMRGDVDDLRSSELLEVQVEGYDGNPRELTYKWTSSLGTYLYIYNSHNMYGINNTYGEYEIYNTDKKISRNSNVEADRSGDKTMSKVGFMWASVYGAYEYSEISEKDALTGTVTVEVFDKNNKSLGKDSFSSFKGHNLDADIDNVVIGIFEGDRVNVLDLLGQSGIVHITCEQSKVSSATILSGDDHIGIEKEKKGNNNYNYFIKGLKAGDNSTNGDAQLEIKITKSTCKFHYKTSGTANPMVYVFKKPKTSTTTTTLTLVSDIDNRCEYFINGNKGEKQGDGTILFTGLNPNTTYTVEVRAKYDDNGKTKYVYGYVEDTTKPVYKATVKTYLDGNIKDVSDIHGDGVNLYLSKDGSTFINLTKTAAGTYEAVVDNGTYFPYHYENGAYNKASKYELIIEHANAELHLHHYSVNYDTNGGAFKNGEKTATEIYSSMSAVNATADVPVREGYVFAGWEYGGKVIASGKEVTASITAPITLKAKWEKMVNVTINVTIDHNSSDSGFDQVETRADLDINFLEMSAGAPAFVETGDKLHFKAGKVTDENGNTKAYEYKCVDNVSTYTATAYTYTGLLESSSFGVALSKSDYDVGAIEKITDENGNWIINVPLKHTPSNFDVEFSFEMAEDVPVELYPDAVIVKIAFWNGEAWEIITQQASTDSVVKPGVRVDIGKDGKGSGSYPVWKYADFNEPYGYRAVVTGFVYGDSTIVVPNSEVKNGAIVSYSDGNYTATMNDIKDGKLYSDGLNGAYYNDVTNAQQGTVHGVITVEKYDVIFDANGGEINGGNTFTEEDEYYVPDTSTYVPSFDGHEFKGWYKDPTFKEPAVKGELLTENITLYAKWDQILTGNVRVAGYYMQNGVMVDVWSIDRAESAVIVLQEITKDGVYNIDRQTVKIVWPMSEMIYGISEEYKFTGLDPAKEYRTEVLVLNYGTAYQNSTTEFVLDENYADDYNADDFKAVYTADSKWKTFVNAYLSFEPASYFQPIEVDATLIGENSRPDNTLVQVMYKATGTDNEYQVISQHTVYPFGVEVGMGTDGMDDGDYGYMVWNSVYDGALYDYQAYLKNIDGDAVSEWPVSVVYGSPSRYSPLNDAATGVLQVKLIPNRYDIIYHEYYIDAETEVTSHDIHIWSYETAINYVPTRDGYVFVGWYATPECTGEKVTAIAETVAENTNLYAKWEKKTDLELTVNYVEKATDNVFETATMTAQVFGDVVTAESLKKDFDGFTFDSASADSITIGTGKNEITLYYVRNSYSYIVNYFEEGTTNSLAESVTSGEYNFGDEITENAIKIDGYMSIGSSQQTIKISVEGNVINFYYTADKIGGGNGDGSDGIPDKYQKKVIFRVVNGTWVDGSTENIVKILNLMKGDSFAVDGTASLVSPKNMIPNPGYGDGEWAVTPPSIVRGTNTVTYTYTFEKKPYNYSFSGSDVVTMYEGESVQSEVKLIPDLGVDTNTLPTVVKYESADESIATVDQNGKITGIKKGRTTVTATLSDGNTYTIHVIVNEREKMTVVFGKTDGIGWYRVSEDGGATYKTVFGNSTIEVKQGTQLIIAAGDLMGDNFTFYVNGNAVKPDENSSITVTVDGYMLIGALGIDPDVDFEVPDVEESLNWFQRIIKAIKDFFAKLFGKK